VKLRLPVTVFLFVLGATASLVGDHSHIVTGTTEYLSDAIPFVWGSPIWFPILVGLATVAIAAVVGPAVEAVIAAAGLARYAVDSDGLFGVAPWLPALYFAFGVVVSLLAEISVQQSAVLADT
jgi:hypothetical protein